MHSEISNLPKNTIPEERKRKNDEDEHIDRMDWQRDRCHDAKSHAT